MKTDIFEFQAEACKTFSNPRRLQILQLLKAGERSVNDITNALRASKPNVSQHLAVMRISGLLESRRNGVNMYYRIANEQIAEACSLMQEALGRIMQGKSERNERWSFGETRIHF